MQLQKQISRHDTVTKNKSVSLRSSALTFQIESGKPRLFSEEHKVQHGF